MHRTLQLYQCSHHYYSELFWANIDYSRGGLWSVKLEAISTIKCTFFPLKFKPLTQKHKPDVLALYVSVVILGDHFVLETPCGWILLWKLKLCFLFSLRNWSEWPKWFPLLKTVMYPKNMIKEELCMSTVHTSILTRQLQISQLALS